MSEPLFIHFHRSPDENVIAHLTADLSSNVQFTFGDDPSNESQVKVLVSGRPTAEEIDRFPLLRKLIIPWAGVPIETFALLDGRPGIDIHNLHHNAVPVAEYALMLMLAAAKNILPMDRALRQADWRPRYMPDTAVLLTGKTALILGYGHIGHALAKYLRAFEMKILPTRNSIGMQQIEDGGSIYPSGALLSLLPEADFLVVALPHTPGTEGLIGENELALLPKNAVLVNIGRGAIIDQAALYDALKQRRIASAGIDVWYNYPKDEESRANTLPADHPFHELDNIVMSPHRAGGLNTDDTERLRMSHLAVLLNAEAHGDEMPNRVDRAKGY
jgi:phosphoglycerate dehydrogenase-like enzyme